MKKVIYISAVVLAFGFTSCNKQDYNPINETTQDTPTWEKGSFPSFEDDDITNDNDDTDNGGIVDPNNDPDGKSKRN